MIAYLIEAGLVLTVVPWTRFWDRNYFMNADVWVRATLLSPWLRGAVTSVGLMTLGAGLFDLLVLMLRRHSSPAESAGTAG